MEVFYLEWLESPSKITFELKPYKSLRKDISSRRTGKYKDPGMEKHFASRTEHSKLGWIKRQWGGGQRSGRRGAPHAGLQAVVRNV